jgi:hypothetical protein
MMQRNCRQKVCRTVAAVATACDRRMLVVLMSLLAALAVVGLAAGVARADASQVRVWNVNLLTLEDRLPVPEENAPLKPISIVAARNGRFSGKVMLNASPAIKGLQAVAGPLSGPGGANIPATAVQIRYGTPWPTFSAHNRPAGLDILLEAAPEEVTQASIWATVGIPADAAAGDYSGEITIQGQGMAPVKVPLKVSVVGWNIPNPNEWRVWIEMIQSIDTSSVEYNVPLWSEAHWQHIARAFELMGTVGSRVVYMPIICHTNYGNAESLIRWIPQEDGSWKHDFSRFERYLDTAIKHMGKPRIVVINAWDIYLNPPSGDIQPIESMPEEHRTHSYHLAVKAMQDARRELRGKGPAVTVVADAAKGEIDTLYLPPLEDPQSVALWKPVWEGMKERLRQRGLLDAAMLGMLTDTIPSREQTTFLHEMSGGMRWVSNAHASLIGRRGGRVHGISEVGYETNVWDNVHTLNPAVARTYGWQRPQHVASHYRLATISRMANSSFRTLLEWNITGNQHGVGRLGADHWWSVRDGRGNRTGTVTSRYLQSQWRNLDILTGLLAPGPDGAVATARLQYLREGAYDSEARIFIESVLLDEAQKAKLGKELADRAQALLDARQLVLWKARGVSEATFAQHGTLASFTRAGVRLDERQGHPWYVDSPWQEDSRKLFALAAEVAAKVGAR